MRLEEIKRGESLQVEYKLEIPKNSQNYIKTVIAFANGRGGKLIFGVEDETWQLVGFPEEEVFLKADAITNAIYDSCTPKIMPEVYVENVEGKFLIVVEVAKGMQKPYCLTKLGPLEGTFIRVSGTTRVAGRATLQQLILDGSNRSFDQLEEKEELITKEEVAAFCEEIYQKAQEIHPDKNLRKITESQLLSWKLIYPEGENYHPSKGYFILKGDAEKFPDAMIQCALFKGKERDIFLVKKDIQGPLDQQIEEANAFVLSHINLGSRIEGVYRQDFYELPTKTIRELIANAVCHRSYLEAGRIQIAIFDDRLEITSPGILDAELSIEDLKKGRCKLRNAGIAHVFRYMDIIESWGSGIPRLYREAQAYGLKEPELLELGDAFRVNLYRKAFETDEYGVVNPEDVGDISEHVGDNPINVGDKKEGVGDDVGENSQAKLSFKERQNRILEVMVKNPKITAVDLSKVFAVTDRTIERDIEKLKKEGRLTREGSDKDGNWIVIK